MHKLCEGMFQTCFECGHRGQVLQSHPLPISPLLQTPESLDQTLFDHDRDRNFDRAIRCPEVWIYNALNGSLTLGGLFH